MASEATIRHAAIIAGGVGSRARSMTLDQIPKALLPVAGRPIIFRQFETLAKEGVSKVSVLGGHLGHQLEQALVPEAKRLSLDLEIVVESSPLGTAGCLTALGKVADDTLIVYGDMLFDMYLAPLLAFHRERSAAITVVAHPNDHPRTSDLLVERDGLVRRVLPRKEPRDGDFRNLVPAGLYLASPKFFGALTAGVTADMIHDMLPALLARGERVAAYNTPEYLRDVGTPPRHAVAEQDIEAGLVSALNLRNRRAAIFFDCDGVLNEEGDEQGIVSPDQVRIIPGSGEALHRARQARYLTVAVTNRPQLAKGLIDLEGLDAILGRLEGELAEKRGLLDRLYFCPHHPEKGFPGEVTALKIACRCRKPGPLMLEMAAHDLPIDLPRSSMIGDSLRDIGAARGAGVWAYGVRTGYGCRDSKRYPGGPQAAPRPDLMFADAAEAVDFLLSYRERARPIVQRLEAIGTAVAPIVVAIAGRSRAGKSTLCHALLRTLRESGKAALHVELDGWILPVEQRREGATLEERHRTTVYRDIVSALKRRESVAAPGYDAGTRGPGASLVYDAGAADIIILDGVLAADDAVREQADVCVFVDTPTSTLRPRFEAFYQWKGIEPDAIADLWAGRNGHEGETIDRQRLAADLTITDSKSSAT